MTAAKEQAKAVLDSVEEIPLLRLAVSPSEARKTIAAGPLRELTLSIERYGVREPLLVRPVSERFEIVSGQRRYIASGLAGKPTAPCLVRELTDDEAAEIRLISNLQREDLPALEEAAAFAELLDRAGSAAAVAAKVGKDIAYVTKRLKLVDLGELGRKALAAGILTVDHALLLARLGEEEQAAALKWCIDYSAGVKTTAEKVVDDRIAIGLESLGGHHQWEPQSAQRLKEHIEQHTGRKLARAPWDLDDAALAPEAGACSACPSNTKSNTSLFGDLDIEDATCANGTCFEWKRAAFVHLQGIKLAAKDETSPLLVSWKISTVKPRWARDGKGPALKQVFKYGQWLDVKKGSCAHVATAVTVDWSDASDRGYIGSGRKLSKPGEVILVCVAEKCKTHPKGWEKAKEAPARENLNQNSPENRAKREVREAEAKAENAIRAGLIRAAIAKVDKLGGNLLRAVVLYALPSWMAHEEEEHFPDLRKGLQSLKVDSADFARAAACLLFVGGRGAVWAYEHRAIDSGRKELCALLKALGFDASKAWDKPAAKPEPAKKAAKGAPKSVKKSPAKKAAKKKAGRR